MRSRLFFLLLLACSSAIAQSVPLGIRGDVPQSRSIVGNYCRMDYQGFRLADDSWQKMKPLTTWKENPDWQSLTIVSQYDISSVKEAFHGATVDVQYSVLGRFETGIGYTPEPHREEVTFHLKDVDNARRIEDLNPAIGPHISKPRAIAWLKSSLATEKDAGNKLALEKALQALGANP